MLPARAWVIESDVLCGDASSYGPLFLSQKKAMAWTQIRHSAFATDLRESQSKLVRGLPSQDQWSQMNSWRGSRAWGKHNSAESGVRGQDFPAVVRSHLRRLLVRPGVAFFLVPIINGKKSDLVL